MEAGHRRPSAARECSAAALTSAARPQRTTRSTAWRQKPNRSQRQPAPRPVSQLVVVLVPQVEQLLQADQGDASLLLRARLGLGVLGEAACADKQAHIVIAQHGHEGAQALDAHGLLLAFHLHLDARRARAQRIGPGQDVHATILAGRRHPGDVVRHGAQQVGHQVLEVVGVHRPQVLRHLSPGLLFCLFERDARCLGIVVRVVNSAHGRCHLGSVAVGVRLRGLPLRVKLACTFVERLGIGQCSMRCLPRVGDGPNAFVLHKPTGLDAVHRCKPDDLFKAARAGFVVIGLIRR
mmetsp:Transcript_986/g.1444  ORF Transcript_986/g.1444 Transcript_986/m.1444 type:complete len:294 (-) Transcript_986:164-1045(-)